ncbi:TPA: hypothetical protein ACP4R4_004480 [Klebsiella pneumoniae]
MKDHEIRTLVNKLHEIAIQFHGSLQLREQIAHTVNSAITRQENDIGTSEPMFYVKGDAAIRLLKGESRYAIITTEPKLGDVLPLYIRQQSAQTARAPKGKRLRIAEDRYAAYFPQERPLDGAQLIAWDENGNLLGIGFGRFTRESGIVIVVGDRKYDSNHVIHWACQ